VSVTPRVVHVVVAGEIGGAERMLVDLARRPGESGAGHAVAVLSPNADLVRFFREAGLRVHDRGPVRESAGAFLWRSLGPSDVAWIEGVLREEQARIAHLHTFASQVVGTRAALRAGARLVRTEHSTRAYVDPSCWPFSRWSLSRVDAAIAISQYVHDIAVGRAPWARDKLHVVPNGVDVDHFSPREGGHDARAGFRFALVGRLEPRKGVDTALEALSLVPGAVLDVVGDGEERSRLEAYADTLGLRARAIFHGRVADPRDVLAGAGAALSSSREEGLGIALLEAMAMARPIAGFAVGGVPEIVRDGVTGWLAKPGSAAALAAVMRTAMADRGRAASMGLAARAFVVERFSVGRMCSGYREVYERLA
jgi:glycosyltransferase involved in cell wall biosynthesis